MNGSLKTHLLCDSGSQICAWPPDPGDQPVAGSNLKAVNGSILKCYGYKQITIQIGRKQYHYQAIKADVRSPILGWDFFRHYRIGFRWNKWGDIELYDRKAQVSQALKFKSVPHLDSLQVAGLSLEQVSSIVTPPRQRTGHVQAEQSLDESQVFQNFFQTASMQELGEVASIQELGEAIAEQSLESVPPGQEPLGQVS